MPIGYRSEYNQILSDSCYSDWPGEGECAENGRVVGDIRPFDSESLHEQECESAGRNGLHKIPKPGGVTSQVFGVPPSFVGRSRRRRRSS